MKTKLTYAEQEILEALLNTHQSDTQLYLDLVHAIPDLHPNQLHKALKDLEKKHFIKFLEAKPGHHLMARITNLGIMALEKEGISTSYKFKNKKMLTYAGIFIAALFLGITLSGGIDSSILTGDIVGEGTEVLGEDSKEYLRAWIEDELGEEDDNYTFKVLNSEILEFAEGETPIRTFMVQCKPAAKLDCAHKIILMELNEETGEIYNVEMPRN